MILLVAAKYDLLAQLGEHHLDRVGVSGSSPLQIIMTKAPRNRSFFAFLATLATHGFTIGLIQFRKVDQWIFTKHMVQVNRVRVKDLTSE
jgi:hypothetical protein